jgi:AraC family transcriptional regulator
MTIADSAAQVPSINLDVPRPPRRAKPLQSDQVSRVIAFINANLAENLSTVRLATIAGLSSSYFCRSFKAAAGCTVQHHVTRCRLAQARQLLRNTSLSLSMIAYECGFADQPHLCNNFRNAMGMSPGRWRREEREANAVGRCGTRVDRDIRIRAEH